MYTRVHTHIHTHTHSYVFYKSWEDRIPVDIALVFRYFSITTFREIVPVSEFRHLNFVEKICPSIKI